MVYFREEQRFRQTWLWTLLIGIFALSIAAVWLMRRDAGISAFVLLTPIALWLYLLKMITEVRDDELMIQFVWLWKARHINLAEIRSARARQYSPIGEYGGWGIRWSMGDGSMAYNVSGNHGVQLELVDGRKILVGSQRSEELALAIATRIG